MHYVTPRPYQMQKHKFGITCPDAFLGTPHRAHLSMKNSASTFQGPDAPECTTGPAEPMGCENTNLA
jgi:hypothetical protein